MKALFSIETSRGWPYSLILSAFLSSEFWPVSHQAWLGTFQGFSNRISKPFQILPAKKFSTAWFTKLRFSDNKIYVSISWLMQNTEHCNWKEKFIYHFYLLFLEVSVHSQLIPGQKQHHWRTWGEERCSHHRNQEIVREMLRRSYTLLGHTSSGPLVFRTQFPSVLWDIKPAGG